MRELFQQYFNIAFLMGKPQDLPAGDTQLRIGVAFAAVTYISALMVPYGLGRALFQASVDLVSTGVVLFMALALLSRKARFSQAFGGLCGASAFVNLAALPLYAMRSQQPEITGDSIAAMADFVLLVWGLSLLAHIVRHTFEVPMVVSVLISFIYFILLASVIAAIVPAPAMAETGMADALMLSGFSSLITFDGIDVRLTMI
ncbi:MAG: hypothetical protein AB8B63_21900 [Granulosicoccus sp.]